MSADDLESRIEHMAGRIAAVAGIEAVVLGGSRGRGTASPDSDIDLGIYYSTAHRFDLETLQQVATDLDDEHRAGILTAPGGWGKWVNGGGWLVVGGVHVDFLYRERERVASVITDCQAGRIQVDYHAGHPHAFPSHIYMGEVAICRILRDPNGILAGLKARTLPYPDALREAVLRTFFWEADFSLSGARKGAQRDDRAYTAGCLFRSAACLLQSLFALNGVYWLNEKGAMALAESFPLRPDRFQERISRVFDPADAILTSVDILEALIQETGKLLATPR